ncbi:MAG TPA: hypothetical protein PK246_08750 [Saprospiraceae bacterium]|nr:hypothetical protein [Saprospiraceae bacterium]
MTEQIRIYACGTQVELKCLGYYNEIFGDIQLKINEIDVINDN